MFDARQHNLTSIGAQRSESRRLERVISWMEDDTPPPYEIELLLSERCNLSCEFCWMRSDRVRFGELPDKRWIEIVKEAIDIGVHRYDIIGGGEPYVRIPLLRTLIDLISNAEKEGVITTNGTLMTNKDLFQLVDRQWGAITFSIDGASAKIHNDLRKRSYAFRKTISAINKLSHLKKIRKTDHPAVNANFVITRKNVHSMEEFVVLCSKLGVGRISFFDLQDSVHFPNHSG